MPRRSEPEARAAPPNGWVRDRPPVRIGERSKSAHRFHRRQPGVIDPAGSAIEVSAGTCLSWVVTGSHLAGFDSCVAPCLLLLVEFLACHPVMGERAGGLYRDS